MSDLTDFPTILVRFGDHSMFQNSTGNFKTLLLSFIVFMVVVFVSSIAINNNKSFIPYFRIEMEKVEASQ